jgi:iron complex outermembrane receptor protein
LAAAQQNGVGRLDTVVVSATNATPQAAAQSLPLAETLITGRQLELAGVASVIELSRTVPNFSQDHAGARSYADTYALRGIANTDFFSDPAVVLYADDVPFGDVVTYTTDLLAVDRVEIFRGPQGSRFGKNSEAGVINVVTRQPTDEFKVEANSSYASFDTQRYQASAAGPLVKGRLRFSLAGHYATSDGFIDNVSLGNHAGELEGINGRASLNWIPEDNWSVDLIATAGHFNDGLGLVSLNSDPRETMSDFNGQYDQSANSQALRVRGQLEGISVTSVTARRDFHRDPFKIDPDFSPIPGNVGVNTWDQTQWSEELRVRPVSPPVSPVSCRPA